MHPLGLPFLAGLAELERTGQGDLSRWDEDQISTAVCFYYCTPHGTYVPKWYRHLLETRPQSIADVQVQFAVSEFHRNTEAIDNLWHLAHEPGHAKVAHYASLPLLRAFPIPCKLKQIRALDHLLWSVIQYATGTSFRNLIQEKLSRTNMIVAQRVRWLAVAAIVSPIEYKDHLDEFVGGSKYRTQQLAVFFCPEDRVRFSFSEVDSSLLELLISLIGRYFRPDEAMDKSGWVTPAMNASCLVRNLVDHLAKVPTESATVAIANLGSDEALTLWHSVLAQVQNSQGVLRRDADFVHPTIKQICQTLNNAIPANSADLSALITDRLSELDNLVQTDNSDQWRPYWNEDSYGIARLPKHENSCRDAILSHLNKFLPTGVQCEPEGQYANDKRADIRVSCRDFQVPVEIKKNQNGKPMVGM